MNLSIFTPFFFITILTFSFVSVIPIEAQCLDTQRNLLLQLNNTLQYDSSYSVKLVKWYLNTDCCSWEGVTCSKAGHVTGLDLSQESISSDLNNSSSLFSLNFLRNLNLAENSLSGEIPNSIGNLTQLISLDLSWNWLSGEIPNSMGNLTQLITVDLSFNKLSGAIPNSMGNLTQLISLDLSANNLSGPIPFNYFKGLLKLESIDLFFNSFSGRIPNSMGNLTRLITVDLSYNDFAGPILSNYFQGLLKLEKVYLSNNSFSGRIPSSLFHLPSLEAIYLNNNQFEGQIPEIPNASSSPLVWLYLSRNKLEGEIPYSFFDLKSLAYLYLHDNTLSGPIPSNYFKRLLKLELVDLSRNSFTGRIPSSLFSLPSLHALYLSFNQFEGQIPEIPNASSSPLVSLYLSRNKLEGEIPYSFFDLKSLQNLDLSHNNQLTVTSDNNSIWSHFPPHLWDLKLASCKLQNFPDLRNVSSLNVLDLSNNLIGGEIPNWIWTFSSELQYLDLSHNFFEKLQEPYAASSHYTLYLDLSSNHLQGEVPIPQNMSFLSFSAANNKLSGTIPQSICNFTDLQVLDLSNNSLRGTIPLCLIEWRQKDVLYNEEVSLAVLNLGENHLTGNISGTFQNNCALEVLDLHDNCLQGKIPKSLVNCTYLQLLNLGNNSILDTFPSFLSNSTSLSILVLRSNLLHGVIPCSGVNNSWSEIQIFDLSSNNFSGSLIPKCFLNFKAMMNSANGLKSRPDYLSYYATGNGTRDYMFKVTVTNKDQQMELEKVLTIFTLIDFSMNNFVGKIPDTIGELKSLYVLNLSHNGFTDSIPSSFGNLKQLGSLDLSVNKLIGKIPAELASLTFLSVLNVSHNQLSGRIPSGGQLQTFPEYSFEGNNGLCGLPSKKSCINDSENVTPTIVDNQLHHEDGTKWEFMSGAGVGYVVGLGIVIVPLFFCKRWAKLYWKYIDRISFLIVGEKYLRRRRGYIKPL